MEPRKRTASERALSNADPLLANKKARKELEAKKQYIISIFSFFLLTYMCSLKETASSTAGPHKAKAGSQKEKVSGSSKVCTCAFGIKHILTQGQANRQPFIEVVDDEDNRHPQKTLPSNSRHLLELDNDNADQSKVCYHVIYLKSF